MEKKQLRQKIQTDLKAIRLEWFHKKCDAVLMRLHELNLMKTVNVVGVTIAKGMEIPTKTFIASCWQQGIQVAVPKCIPKTKQMNFYIIESFEQLETVYMDIEEPITDETIYAPPETIDVLIVPGVVFDLYGYRIGYGGGYYDRYLPQFPNKTVALCLEMQIVANVPKDSYDYPIDYLLTEKRTIHCKKHREEETNG